MSVALSDGEPRVHDLVGVGFGPANLALGVALAEHNGRAGGGATVTALFVERQPRFGWHRGMLIDDATMQVSFLKDLATLRDPTSRFSFLNYLHARNRLVDFINHKNLFPLRVEFHDYLEWAAAKVDDLVSYGSEALSVRPVRRDGVVESFDVEVADTGRSGARTVHRARNVVFATGLRPFLPQGATASERIWHSHDLLHRVEALNGTDPPRFVVVGTGQSAAEATAYLHRRFPRSEVCAVFSRYGYSPADDSPFANRIFDPAAVDDFYRAPGEVKRSLMAYHGNTNYSVVDTDLIDDLYRRSYQEKVLGTRRLRMFNLAHVIEAADTGAGVRTTVRSLDTGEDTVLDADVAVYATGYRPADPAGLLDGLDTVCLRDEQGRPRVRRDYSVRTPPEVVGRVYLQGGTEHTHGITSSLLSNAAIRAGEILESVADRPSTARGGAPQHSATSV